jgi:hypothetical protein
MTRKTCKGDLVEPIVTREAAYSRYAGRPRYHYSPGMLGVVRTTEPSRSQVQFFSQETGNIEAVWMDNADLKKVVWPEEKLPPDSPSTERGWWFCGSLDWKGQLKLLQAVATLRPAYFLALHPETLRISSVHASRLRKPQLDAPEIDGDADHAREIALAIAEMRVRAAKTVCPASNDGNRHVVAAVA